MPRPRDSALPIGQRATQRIVQTVSLKRSRNPERYLKSISGCGRHGRPRQAAAVLGVLRSSKRKKSTPIPVPPGTRSRRIS